MRKVATTASLLLGAIMIVAAIVTWIVISNTLSEQNITVAEDASCMAGATVSGPLSAYCQAQVIDKHTMEITRGKTYAELDREDPLRATAMNSAFLQSSLFTSIVAFGVAAMAAAVGLCFILIGLGIRDVSQFAAPPPAPAPAR